MSDIFCNPLDCSLPGSFFRGISPARILAWVDISFLQAIFPSQRSNLGLLQEARQEASLSLSHHGSPFTGRWEEVKCRRMSESAMTLSWVQAAVRKNHSLPSSHVCVQDWCAEQLRQIQTLPTDNFKPCTVHRGLTGWVPAQLSFLDGFQHF